MPDDKSKYTITFGSDGRVTTRVDCNRAGSTWKSPRAGELQFRLKVANICEVSARIASRQDRYRGANIRSSIERAPFLNGHAGAASMSWSQIGLGNGIDPDVVSLTSCRDEPNYLTIGSGFRYHRTLMRIAGAAFFVFLLATICAAQSKADQSQVSFVTSKDGTRIAVECAGAGPNLLIVHGGTGDRKRWHPLLPLFARSFNVCAMDRRGHGQSQPGEKYALRKESEDVVAVVNSRRGPVFVLGHSIGGVFALEAAFLTNKITRLALYEPPLQDLDHSAVADRMEHLIQGGDREQALIMFFRDIVMMSPQEIETARSRPVWPARVAGIDVQLREIRALNKYRFNPSRIRKVRVPVLLLIGSKTRSPQLKQAVTSLVNTLPNRTLVILEGEEHNAMDTIPQQFADQVTRFLLQP